MTEERSSPNESPAATMSSQSELSPANEWVARTSPQGKTFYYNEALCQAVWDVARAATEGSEAAVHTATLTGLKTTLYHLTENKKKAVETAVANRAALMAEEPVAVKSMKEMRAKGHQLELEIDTLEKDGEAELAAISAAASERARRFQEDFETATVQKAQQASELGRMSGNVIPKLRTELDALVKLEKEHATVVMSNKALVDRVQVLALKLRSAQEATEWHASRLNLLLCPTCQKLKK